MVYTEKFNDACSIEIGRTQLENDKLVRFHKRNSIDGLITIWFHLGGGDSRGMVLLQFHQSIISKERPSIKNVYIALQLLSKISANERMIRMCRLYTLLYQMCH